MNPNFCFYLSGFLSFYTYMKSGESLAAICYTHGNANVLDIPC